LLALASVAVFVTAIVGWSARDVARRQVEHDFEQRIRAATQGARDELVWEADTLGELLVPLCKHDSFVDRTLLDLERARGQAERLPAGRGIAIQKLVPEQRKALRLDSLLLITGDGLVLGANNLADVGRRDASLAERLGRKQGVATLNTRGYEAAIEVHCARSSGGVTLGLIGTRNVEPILDRISRAYGVRLSLTGQEELFDQEQSLRRALTIPEIDGLEVTATISRQPLFEGLAQIDSSIFLTGAIAVLLSVALAVFLARSLSQPLVELARQTRQVVRGKPTSVRGRGGREIVQLAKAFNRTIEELAAMRNRLARTERIAARREVAQQVAHEIKNPLAPIQAAVETLRRLRARESPQSESLESHENPASQRSQFDDYFDEATKTVLDEVHRIKSIVSEFSQFARMPPPNFASVDIEELARGVTGLYDAKDDTRPRVLLTTETLPQVMADRDQLTQLLTNLIKNGLEAAGAVREDAAVEVELSRAESDVRLTVSDNGPGVDEAVVDRLFEPYVTTKPEGTGLGLAICQTIAHEHGGEIGCHSSNAGAVFEVLLPIEGPPLLAKAPRNTG